MTSGMAPAGATAGVGLPGAGMQGMSEQEQAMVKAVSQYTPEPVSGTWTREIQCSEREGQNRLTRIDARGYGIVSREDCHFGYDGIWSWWCVWFVHG